MGILQTKAASIFATVQHEVGIVLPPAILALIEQLLSSLFVGLLGGCLNPNPTPVPTPPAQTDAPIAISSSVMRSINRPGIIERWTTRRALRDLGLNDLEQPLIRAIGKEGFNTNVTEVSTAVTEL